MLSYKNNQTIPPLYDYYVETDLDSLDDQPVDYSKRYADQDSYEDCRRRKSNVKSNEYPATEVSQSMKPSCRSSTDELKVYCIEGTPVTISSASSFSDLRDIGVNNSQHKSGVKCAFPSANDDEVPQSPLGVEKNAEQYINKKDDPHLTKGKDEINREVKSVSFRSGDDISKASSPLMFSRSSSVGSLNSFEQQSIADDRSSVSAFSALTSGLISPSDLPDSPGEVMSPVLTDKGNSPKIESSKANSDNESENIECDKAKAVPELALENKSAIPSVQMPKSKEYIPVESYKSVRNSDEEENEILAQQLEFSHDSSAEIDEVFSNPEYETDAFVLKSERDSCEQLSIKSDGESDADDILLQQCIQLGMPYKSSDNKCDISVSKKAEYSINSRSIPDSHIYMKKENICEDSVSGQSEIIQPFMKLTMQEEPCVQSITNIKILHQSHLLKNEQLTTDLVKSDEDSDGEDDVMLQRCIELGMPKGCPNNSEPNADIFLKPCHPSHSVNHESRHEQLNTGLARSDEDSDGEDDEMLQRCIELGMPKGRSDKSRQNTGRFLKPCYTSHPVNHNTRHDLCDPAAVKSDEDSDGDDILLQNCIKLGLPNKPVKNRSNVHTFKQVEGLNVPVKSAGSEVMKNNAVKPSQNPYGNEGDNLLPHCTPTRVTKESQEKKRMNSRVFSKPDCPLYSANYGSPKEQLTTSLAKSDEDSDGEDDVMLQRCIELGMPKGCPDSSGPNADRFLKPCYPSHSVNHNTRHDMCNPESVKFDDDSDGDDILLQNCIKLGLPNKPREKRSDAHTYKQMECHSACPKSNRSQIVKNNPVKSKSPYINEGSNLLPHCTQTRMTKEMQEKKRMNSRMFNKPDCPPYSASYGSPKVTKKMYPLKSEGDSDGDGGDMILRQCIETGMPKESWEKKKFHPSIFNKPGYSPHSVSHFSPTALRDSCPDGISDADEEDDMLAKCIRAGMPSPKIVADVQNRLHNSQTNVPTKLQPCNRSYLPNTAPDSNRKVGHFGLPPSQPYAPVHSSATWISRTSFIDVDSMRIYRTEDTPILSPSASISDLSSLSFNESFLNNSRNSDCSSDSDDDELLLQCIRSGMPEAKRAAA